MTTLSSFLLSLYAHQAYVINIAYTLLVILILLAVFFAPLKLVMSVFALSAMLAFSTDVLGSEGAALTFITIIEVVVFLVTLAISVILFVTHNPPADSPWRIVLHFLSR